MVQEGTSQIQVRLPVTVHRALKEEAKRQDRSLNWLLNRLLTEAAQRAQQQGAAQ